MSVGTMYSAENLNSFYNEDVYFSDHRYYSHLHTSASAHENLSCTFYGCTQSRCAKVPVKSKFIDVTENRPGHDSELTNEIRSD